MPEPVRNENAQDKADFQSNMGTPCFSNGCVTQKPGARRVWLYTVPEVVDVMVVDSRKVEIES